MTIIELVDDNNFLVNGVISPKVGGVVAIPNRSNKSNLFLYHNCGVLITDLVWNDCKLIDGATTIEGKDSTFNDVAKWLNNNLNP